MKKFSSLKSSAIMAFAALLCAPVPAFAQSIFKTAGNFVLLGGTAVTSDGTVGTVVTNGNVGSATAITGFFLQDGGPAVITPPGLPIVGGAVVGQAILDLGTAKAGLTGMVSTVTMSGVDLGGKTLTPGVYKFAVAAAQNGNLVLDAQGKDGVFWVFQIGTTLTTAAGSTVTIINTGPINHGSDDGIFWVAGAGINFGANNLILGNYLAGTAITFTIGTSGILGSRAMSQAGVTLIQNQINARGGPSGSDWTGGVKFAPNGTTVVAIPTITWATPAAITYGSILSATQLNATATLNGTPVAGIFTYTPASGTLPGAGVNQTLSVAFAPTDTTAFGTASATTTITVNQAPQAALTLTPLTAQTYLTSRTFAVSGGSGSGVTITDSLSSGPATRSAALTYTANSGTTGYTVSITKAGDANYLARTDTFAVPVAPASQTITFAALPTKILGSGTFALAATASSGLTVSYASSNPAVATVSGSTVTLVGTGTSTITASQAGGSNFLAAPDVTQVLTVGAAPVITSPISAVGTVGAAFSYTITATNSPTSYTTSALPAGLTLSGATISGTPTVAAATLVTLSATNAVPLTGSGPLTITIGAAGAAPIISPPFTAAGTVGTLFSYTIAATNAPTSYTASPLPAGLTIVAATGAITGTPTVAGTTSVLLGATNAFGTGNATLVITVAAAGLPPVINSPLTAAGTVGAPFGYAITATNSPTSYAASPLPAGLSIVAGTGAITGTPTAVGTTSVLLGATNAFGTGNATLVITVAAAGLPPVINSPLTAAGTVGTPFGYAITATNSPTSYTASPLPAGLSIVAATGVITGTPTTAGTTTVQLGATNAFGTGTATLTIAIAAAGTGAAPVITNNPLVVTAAFGVPFSFTITATNSPTSFGAFNLPPGLFLNSQTGVISGTPTRATTTFVTLSATNAFGTGTAVLMIVTAPSIGTPANTTVVRGGGATFSAGASVAGATYQWQKDGVNLPGANGPTLAIGNVQPGNVGFYTLVITGSSSSTTTAPALLEMTFAGKTAGSATEVGPDIHHANGKIYDQVLLQGASASVKADAGQMTRVSYIDLNDDIVQVEFSGAGALTINLENASGPAVAAKYNQPGVVYMKGHATIAVTGANDSTNVSVFSVGPITALDQTLFRAGTSYDGWADIALVTVATVDGRFGGVRSANANYFRAVGMTGVYAPGVQFSGAVYLGDIDAAGSAAAFLMLGSGADVRITGGDLFQDNAGGIEVSGMTRLQFTAGTSSQGALIVPQVNRGRLMTNDVNVTSQLVSP